MESLNRFSLRSLDANGRPPGTGRSSASPGSPAGGTTGTDPAFAQALARDLEQRQRAESTRGAERSERSERRKARSREGSGAVRSSRRASGRRESTDRAQRAREAPRRASERHEPEVSAPRGDHAAAAQTRAGRGQAAPAPPPQAGEAAPQPGPAAAQAAHPMTTAAIAAAGVPIAAAAGAAEGAPAGAFAAAGEARGATTSSGEGSAAARESGPRPTVRATTASAHSKATAGAPDLERAERILEQVRLKIVPELRRAIVELRPQHLGRVTIRLQVEDGEVAAYLSAERPETLSALERHVPELRAMLAQAGFETSTFTFDLAQESGGDAAAWAEGNEQRGAEGSHAEEDPPRALLRALASADGVDILA